MPQASSQHSPFQDGFAALWHDPTLLAAELMWRWCFGLAAWAVTITGFVWFLDSIEISPRDELMVRTGQPLLLTSAAQHIFRGSLSRLTLLSAALLLGVALFWCLASTAGRAATLARLVAMFRDPAAGEGEALSWHFVPILTLQFVHATWSLLARAVVSASLVLAVLLAADRHPLRAALVLLLGAGLGSAFGVVLGRIFGLAPLFCVRHQSRPGDALMKAVDFSARSSGRMFLPGMGFLLLRLLWFGVMTSITLSAVAVLSSYAVGWSLAVCAVFALVYFAGADFLSLAQLAAWVCVAEDDALPSSVANQPLTPGPVLPSTIAPVIDPA